MQLKTAYPDLRTVDILQAQVQEARGDVAQAIAAYQAAVEAGEREANVLERRFCCWPSRGGSTRRNGCWRRLTSSKSVARRSAD